MRLFFLYVFLFNSFAPSAFGQENLGVGLSDTTYALPEIRINSTRYTADARYVAARISHIDNQVLKSTGGRSLDEVLQRASGVFLREYGTGLSSLSMRGGNSSHSIVTIDGMPLYDPQLGQVDLSLVPSMLLENISIMYGQGASLYGANGLAGVVDIETPAHQNIPIFGSIKATVGAYGERHADGGFGFKKSNIRGVVAVRHGGEEGDFSYEDLSLFPVERVRRQGADRLFSSYFGKFDWTQSQSISTLSAWVNTFERGIPGPITLQFRDERQWDKLLRLNAQHIRAVKKGTLSIQSGLQRMSLRYVNPFLDIDDTGLTTSLSLDSYYKRTGKDNNTIKIGADNAFRAATHPSLSEEARELQTSLYFLGEFSFSDVVMLPSMRWDRYGLPESDAITAFSPNLGATLNPSFIPALFVKAQVGKSFRAPTFNDRFWQPGGIPELLPEIGWGYEGGLLWKPVNPRAGPSISSEVTLYQQHIRDQITWLPTDNGYWSPRNVQGVLLKGFESSVAVESFHARKMRARFELIYHLTDTRNRSDSASPSYDKPLRYSPRHLFKTIVGLKRAYKKGEIGVDVFSQYISKRFVTEDGRSSIPSYWTVDMRIHSSFSTRRSVLSLSVLLENVFDREYEVIKGYLMPPRLVRIELGIHWPGKGTSPQL